MDLHTKQREALRSRLLLRLGAFLVSAALLVSLVAAPPRAKAAFTEAGLLASLIVTYMVSAGIIVSPGDSFTDFLGPYIADFEQSVGVGAGKFINFLGYESSGALMEDIKLQFVSGAIDALDGKYKVFIPQALSAKLAEFVKWFVDTVFTDVDLGVDVDPITGYEVVSVPLGKNNGKLPGEVYNQFFEDFRFQVGSAFEEYTYFSCVRVLNCTHTNDVEGYKDWFYSYFIIASKESPVETATKRFLDQVIVHLGFSGAGKYYRYGYGFRDGYPVPSSFNGLTIPNTPEFQFIISPEAYINLPKFQFGDVNSFNESWYTDFFNISAPNLVSPVTIARPGVISYPVDREGERDTVLTVPAGDYAVPKDPAIPDGDLITVPGLGEGIGSIGELLEGITERIDTIPIEGAIAEEAVKPEKPPQTEPEDIDGLGLPTLAALLTTRFPFSIPWDLSRSVELLSAPAQVPVFEVDFMAPISKRVGGWKGSTKITLDFSEFETLAALCRWTSTLGFCFFLVGATKRYIWTA